METAEPYRIKTIADFHHLLGLPKPQHPLISVIELDKINDFPSVLRTNRVLDFYTISLKRNSRNFSYGQQQYEVQQGTMYFIAPGQVYGPMSPKKKEEETRKLSGWGLYIHPDFLWNTFLAKGIKKYDYFTYSVHEALCLSDSEEQSILSLVQTIQTESLANPDQFGQAILISLLEVLLNYADRFYHRQFLTRRVENHQLLDRLEALLNHYFSSPDLTRQGLPSVQFVADQLNLSPNYLSSLLKVMTGRNTQQHIQDKAIEKAKEKISTSGQSVSEISYELGFEYPQSFSRLFKTKTGLSPQAFRQRFN